MEIILDQQGIQYRQAGDYLLPNIAVGDEKEYHIGIWCLLQSSEYKNKFQSY